MSQRRAATLASALSTATFVATRTAAVPAAALALVAAVAAAGCGADSVSSTCQVSVVLTPTDPVAPQTITARATAENALGVLDFQWQVRFGSDVVATTPRTPSGDAIDFVANDGGIYTVALTVPGCDVWSGDLNVGVPSAVMRTVRLRFIPPGGTVPGQERVVAVPGGADWSAGVLTIEPGTATAIAVRDPLGALVPSYVRLSSRATPDATVELVTGATGSDRIALATGAYDVLLVPLAGDLAPALVLDWDPLIDPLSALAVDGGQVLTGVVRDPAGAALAGARVALEAQADRAPSTVAVTASDGRFAVRWPGGAAGALTIVPPIGAGLPRLTAPLAGLALGQPLTVRYAASLAPIELGGLPVALAGAPAAGGHVTFALERAGAATISDGAVSRDLAGRHRDTIAVDASGRLAAYRASASAGRAFVGAAADDVSPGAVVLLDLTGGAPAGLDGAAPVVLTGSVTDRDGAPLSEVRVRATLNGDLAHLGAASPIAITGDGGQLGLVVAAGASYDLEVVDLRLGHASDRRLISAAAPIGAIALEPAVRVRGEIRLSGHSTGLAAVGVSALCYVCAGLDRTRPLGDAVSDSSGAFTVAIPDPGTTP